MNLTHLSLRRVTDHVPAPPSNRERAEAFERAVSRSRNVEQSFAYQRIRYAMEQAPQPVLSYADRRGF